MLGIAASMAKKTFYSREVRRYEEFYGVLCEIGKVVLGSKRENTPRVDTICWRFPYKVE